MPATLHGTRSAPAILVAALMLMAGCGTSGAATSSDLAETVAVEGFRKVAEYRKADTTSYYFVGPPGADLAKVVSARNWSPEPVTATFREDVPYRWLLSSSADFADFSCTVMVLRLNPVHSNLADGLTVQEKKDVAAGKLDYLDVSSVCMKMA